MEEQSFNVGSLWSMVRRRAKLVGIVAGATLLGAILVAALLPNQYQSSTTILVEPQTISRRLVEAGLEESDINSRLHLMTMQILSRPRLSRVIDDLKLYQEESDEMTREEVIQLMRDHIRVEPVLPELEASLLRRRTDYEINTFRLFFTDGSARTAAQVANRLANDFIDEHIRDRVQVSGDTAEFIEGELTRLATRIREVEAQIAQVKGENSGSLPEDLLSNQRQLEHSVENLRYAQRRLSEAESDRSYYGQQAESAGFADSGMLDVVSPARRLQMLENELGEVRARGLTDKHPDVIALSTEIEELKLRIDLEEDGPVAVSAAKQNAEAERRRAELRAQAARAEIALLQDQIRVTEARLAATPRVAELLDGLQRDYLHLGASFQEFSNKRLDASVAANMERRQKGEQFRVLESAFPSPDPVSPNRPLIALLGLVLGLALGAGVGILLEAADSSYHDALGLQQSLRLPVLASIPSVLLDADRRARRRKRMRELVAALVVTGVVLMTAAVGYVLVNRPGLLGDGEAPPPPAAAQAES